jgi:hypothetical protein
MAISEVKRRTFLYGWLVRGLGVVWFGYGGVLSFEDDGCGQQDSDQTEAGEGDEGEHQDWHGSASQM